MTHNKRLLSVALIAGLWAMAFSPGAEAQFLKKLSEGLKKVESVIDKFTGDDNRSSKKEEQKSSQQSAVAAQASAASNRVDDSDWKEVEATAPTPFLTPDTKFLEGDPQSVTNVYEDVFCVRRGQGLEFWRINGKKLFEAEWQYCGGDTWIDGETQAPFFNGGVAPARRLGGDNRICLLYLDGRVKQGDPTWQEVSNFCDGLALVEAKVNYNNQYYFIDRNGNKKYAHLKLTEPGYGERAMRPLRDGLRAVCVKGNTNNREWAFIDGNGNIKLSGYTWAGDFSEGYAWVEVKNTSTGLKRKQLIDTKGNVVRQTDADDKVFPVKNGIYRIVKSSGDHVYSDLTGKTLGTFAEGTDFFDGYALVRRKTQGLDWNPRVYAVNTRMEQVNSYEGSDVPNVQPYGLGPIYSKSTLVNYRGEIILEGYGGDFGAKISGFERFAASGYGLCTSVYLNNELCRAIIKPTGEVVWIISKSTSVGGPYDGTNPPIKPTPPPIPDPTPPLPPEPPVINITYTWIDIYMIAEGPKEEAPRTYSVAVAANPGEGGTVTLTPKATYEYGEYATVTASPNEGWGIASVTTSAAADGYKAPRVGQPFGVYTDQTITVNFVKEEEYEVPYKGGDYMTTLPLKDTSTGTTLYEIPVYLHLDTKCDESTPYGPDTYGYLAIQFDPAIRYTATGASLNIFAVPLRVCGVQTDDSGRRWMILDGGSATIHDLKIETGNMLGNLWFNTILKINNFVTVTSHPRHYRVEMIDVNESTGEFTLGTLQTYSPQAGGWVAGADESVTETTHGTLMSWSDHGYESYTFTGSELKACQPREVLWYPPQSWFKEESLFNSTIESMKNGYRNAQSDYYQMFSK